MENVGGEGTVPKAGGLAASRHSGKYADDPRKINVPGGGLGKWPE